MPQRKPVQVVLSVIATLVVLAVVISGLAHAVTQLNTTAAADAQATTTSAVVAPTAAQSNTPALSVRGRQIVDAHHHAITLLGAARFSLEFACHGDGHFQLSDFQAMRAWGMNTVRITLSSAFWRNLDNHCPNYQATVTSAVDNAEAAGLYVILTLQWNAPFSLPDDSIHGGAQCPLPDTSNDVKFWQDLAEIYQDDSRVLFDIYSEPNNIDWTEWANGGTVSSNCSIYPDVHTYTAIGMRALAIKVRAVAPNNIIVVSGIGYGYDLSGIDASNRVPTTNILYGTHPFDHKVVQQPSDWPRAFGDAALTLPIIATEFGAYDCTTQYISQEIAYFGQLHLSFLAWAWSPGDCALPSLIANWSGTPTTPYGAYIKQQMHTVAAKQGSL